MFQFFFLAQLSVLIGSVERRKGSKIVWHSVRKVCRYQVCLRWSKNIKILDHSEFCPTLIQHFDYYLKVTWSVLCPVQAWSIEASMWKLIRLPNFVSRTVHIPVAIRNWIYLCVQFWGEYGCKTTGSTRGWNKSSVEGNSRSQHIGQLSRCPEAKRCPSYWTWLTGKNLNLIIQMCQPLSAIVWFICLCHNNILLTIKPWC